MVKGKSRYKIEFKTSKETLKRAEEWRNIEENRQKRKDYMNQYYKEKREHRIKRNSECQKIRVRRYKIDAMKKIAEHHNNEVKCWRCGEKRLWVLTIAHINNDGNIDRKENGFSTTKLYRRILDNERQCDDLQIECFNCNCVRGFFGKYPDEIGDV